MAAAWLLTAAFSWRIRLALYQFPEKPGHQKKNKQAASDQNGSVTKRVR
jgi:hypothetical protein